VTLAPCALAIAWTIARPSPCRLHSELVRSNLLEKLEQPANVLRRDDRTCVADE